MEIKATLNKPYTKEQRLEFIVSQNRQLGYEIRETENALEAWGNTEEEQQQISNQVQISNIKGQMNNLDSLSIRPLRAISSGNYTEEDTAMLQQLEMQMEELREELKELLGV